MVDSVLVLYLVILALLVIGVFTLLVSLVWTAHREYMVAEEKTRAAREKLDVSLGRLFGA